MLNCLFLSEINREFDEMLANFIDCVAKVF